jgi:hypothetical protein
MFCGNGDLKNLITAIGLLFWFKGMYRILDYYIPDTIANNLILVILSFSIIYINVGSLHVLGPRQISEEEERKINGDLTN